MKKILKLGCDGKDPLHFRGPLVQWLFQKQDETRRWVGSSPSSFLSPLPSFDILRVQFSSYNGKPINNYLHPHNKTHPRRKLGCFLENKIEKKGDINRLINYWELNPCVNSILCKHSSMTFVGLKNELISPQLSCLALNMFDFFFQTWESNSFCYIIKGLRKTWATWQRNMHRGDGAWKLTP